MRTVGSYEAKTHLPRLLEEVAAGEESTITKHGVPVAELVPPPGGKRRETGEVMEEVKKFRKGKKQGCRRIRELGEEGLRW